MSPRRVMVVAGARPNFMKVAPVLRELRQRQHCASFVHTGQHYGAEMSDSFLRDLEIPVPDHVLGVGSGSHAEQTARILTAFEPVLERERPEWLVVVGDVNSTLACALVAAKRPDLGTRVAHVEAGLRSGDWAMPEEVNRVLTDRLSQLLLTPSDDARANLVAEGIAESMIVFVGNVMIDTLMHLHGRAKGMARLVDGAYAVATLHRPSNVDDHDQLRELLRGLALVAERMPVVFPAHPRTVKQLETSGLRDALGEVRVVPPLGYLEMLGALDGASIVLTDSGGIQEETTVLGVPCVTLRASTERPVTVTKGTNRMIAWPPTAAALLRAASEGIERGRVPLGACAPTGWDGLAAARIVDAIEVA
jgi:UDP-N-acetylglucosamine 2-epimerase (non-hydrolysing)